MPGVIVTLSDKNGNPMIDLVTGAEAITTTAAGGSYWFTGLARGGGTAALNPRRPEAPPLPSSLRRPLLRRPSFMAPIGPSLPSLCRRPL